MANVMTTRVQFKNLNEQTFGKLIDLLPFEGESSGQVNIESRLGKLLS